MITPHLTLRHLVLSLSCCATALPADSNAGTTPSAIVSVGAGSFVNETTRPSFSVALLPGNAPETLGR